MAFDKDRSTCSPYLVVPMVILLITVTVRYWTVSNENVELADTLQKMNTMLKVNKKKQTCQSLFEKNLLTDCM